MKDLNFLEIDKDCGFSLMELTSNQNKLLKKIIINDSMFLESLGLMDYSLLLVIEEVQRVK